MATRGLNAEAIGKVTLGVDEGLVGYVGEEPNQSISKMLRITLATVF